MSQSLTVLRRLEALRLQFGDTEATDKLALLHTGSKQRFTSADQLLRWHELLCFMQAWPDTPQVLHEVEQLLDHLTSRPDFRRHAADLADTGIAGTPIYFSFYSAAALWLTERWPAHLQIDWDAFENIDTLEPLLPMLATDSEIPALDSITLDVPEWLDRLKGSSETDADFLIRRFRHLVANYLLHEHLYEELDVPLILDPGSDTPSRTHTKQDAAAIVFQTNPLDQKRPRISDQLQLPLDPPRQLGRTRSSQLVDAARGAMATRHRDLDAFAYADERDVTIVNDTGGLQFVLYGMLPERRFLLETQYGYLILKNGVPVSYGALTCLFQSAELAYTILDTFRGGESARIYVRLLVMAQQIFGCNTFMIDPYQLGQDNEDALQSGAWWFYQKLGYRPRHKAVLKLMNQELARMRKRPGHRSSISTLQKLATENVYLSLAEQRDDVLGELELDRVGLRIVDLLAERFGAQREQGLEVLSQEAAQRLQVTSFTGWSRAQRQAWSRWAPLVALLQPDRWPRADRQALAEIIRAKGGRRELEYLHQFDQHRRLRDAIAQLGD